MDSIDITNKFRVTDHAGSMVTFAPIPGYLSHDDALRLAAWLVVTVDPQGACFPALLKAVQDTKA